MLPLLGKFPHFIESDRWNSWFFYRFFRKWTYSKFYFQFSLVQSALAWWNLVLHLRISHICAWKPCVAARTTVGDCKAVISDSATPATGGVYCDCVDNMDLLWREYKFPCFFLFKEKCGGVPCSVVVGRAGVQSFVQTILREGRKVGDIRYEARSRGRSSPDTLAIWACETPRR